MIKHRRALRGALTLAVVAGVTTGTLAGSAPPPQNTAAAAESTHPADHARLRALLHRLTTVDGGPGALIAIRDRRDRPGSTVLTSGVADVRSHAPVRGDSRFRIGSMTKTFVATVMLQLVGERRVVLDAPVEHYLPGVVRGHGNDGRRMTVRQLLQHTSGVPDVLDHLSPQEILKDPLAHHDARDLVNIALAHPPTFEPGSGWRYSSTGYLLAGMIIERVTGQPYGDEIRRRVIAPLGLHATYVPGDASAIPGPHPRGYVRPGANAPLMDLTAINPSVAGAGGEMISSGTDINRFLGALLGGRLLRPAQLREMMRTRPTGDPDGRAYGLGLESRPLPCGGRYWGHSGDMFGYETVGGATVGGRQATVMVNLDPGGSDAQSADMKAAVRTALCTGRPSH
ncbi:serine hydrolase domain-containing protein [Streptomyces flavofungini]|uniref:Beta-lactamase family protein n=1 Tax=Streptomyces flavofungini TaxID=68200 RepID=A0ABS0X7X4_9ACTN|nr:serine hydrolase domain-containing protein [Streptomyces flavofungini]MBJ3809312.1 beta-lactamase family protein [Streptomyces flavofungini]GHC77517.1 serine hydrolase [Streptomyces flavofungini]